MRILKSYLQPLLANARCQELANIGCVEVLHRIMTLSVEQLRQLGTLCENIATTFFDTVLTAVFKYVNLSKRSLIMGDCKNRKLSF